MEVSLARNSSVRVRLWVDVGPSSGKAIYQAAKWLLQVTRFATTQLLILPWFMGYKACCIFLLSVSLFYLHTKLLKLIYLFFMLSSMGCKGNHDTYQATGTQLDDSCIAILVFSSRVTDGAHRFLQFRIISLMIHVWIFCVIALFLYFLFRYLLQYFPFKLFFGLVICN